jgi:hypothetical protein
MKLKFSVIDNLFVFSLTSYFSVFFLQESCWSRFFKNCSPCCASLSCSSCCRPKDDSPRARDNDSPGTCTRIFCFCCLCCRGKPESEQQQTLKRPSQQSHKG